MNRENNLHPGLRMTFTPNTIEHLGVRMYSTLPPVISELIANAYDADANDVHIHLKDEAAKEIIITDNGHGMSFDDINQKFLRIGRNRRNDEGTQTSPGGRKVIGKKGLGKLSFFGIAHEIEVQTTQGNKRNSFLMKWDDILSDGDGDQQKDYPPTVLEHDTECKKEKGTVIILRDIQRISDFNANSLADNLSKFFIIDPDFNIYVKYNDGDEILIENERKYTRLKQEIRWNVPTDIDLDTGYERQAEVKGYLIATEKPISPATNMKGITLFSRKKLVNLPEYFSDSTSSHFFTYLTGWLEIDFIDDLGEDVIGTNRQSLNWTHPEMVKLREYLQKMLKWLERDWREKRNEIKKKKLDDKLKESGVTIANWQAHIPDNINKKLTPVLEAIIKESEFSNQEIAGTVKKIQEIIPEYPYYHWQNLHIVLHSLALPYYKNGDYYTAVYEGVKKYIRMVQTKSTSGLTDSHLIRHVFSPIQPSSSTSPASPVLPELSVTKKYKKPDGTDFEMQTTDNISKGHGLLSRAMWLAFRNPIAHEVVEDLRDSGLYTEQDCLDALGLLSHLFRRLDNAERN